MTARDWAEKELKRNPSLNRDELLQLAQKSNIPMTSAYARQLIARITGRRVGRGKRPLVVQEETAAEASVPGSNDKRRYVRDTIADGVRSLKRAVEVLGREAVYQILGQWK